LGAEAENVSHNNDLMLSSGMTWVRKRASYGQGAYAITQAHESGMKILLKVTGDGSRAYDTENQSDFVRFLANLAEQGADAIEVWDEPNIDRNMAVTDPEEFTALLCAAYSAIRAANPETLVISGAPAPTSFYGGCTPSGCDDVPWLQGLVAAGAAECLDMVGVKYLVGATIPSERVGNPIGDHPSYYFFPNVERYHKAFGGTKPLAFTALGYLSPEGYGELPAAFAWAANTTIADQATWTAETVQIAVEDNRIGMIILFSLDATGWMGSDVRAGWVHFCLLDKAIHSWQTYEEPRFCWDFSSKQ
jgi:hypothetical protein